MNTSIEYHEAFNPCNSPMPILSSCVRVVFEGYDAWTFKGDIRTAYKDACRFERLVSLGYAPPEAYHLSLNGDHTTWAGFGHLFRPVMHGHIVEEKPLPMPELDCSLVSDWLTDAYIEEFGLEDGDEVSLQDVAHFYATNYGNDVPPPHWLVSTILENDERSFEERKEKNLDDGSFDGQSHHLAYIPY